MNMEISEENKIHGDITRPSGSSEPEKRPDIEVQETPKPVDVPPDGGYGWVCVACVFIINAHTWGVNSVSPCPSVPRGC
jgi:hypothetical protein